MLHLGRLVLIVFIGFLFVGWVMLLQNVEIVPEKPKAERQTIDQAFSQVANSQGLVGKAFGGDLDRQESFLGLFIGYLVLLGFVFVSIYEYKNRPLRERQKSVQRLDRQ